MRGARICFLRILAGEFLRGVLLCFFMLLIVAKFACLTACYFGGLIGGVFFHELGHALAALLATRQGVEMEIGSAGKRGCIRLGRLDLVFRSRGQRYGSTRYDRSRESRGAQAFVAIGGPLASLLATAVFVWIMVSSTLGSWGWIICLGLAIANFRILIVAVWPIKYRPDGEDGDVWLSDGLDLWRLLTNKQN